MRQSQTTNKKDLLQNFSFSISGGVVVHQLQPQRRTARQSSWVFRLRGQSADRVHRCATVSGVLMWQRV